MQTTVFPVIGNGDLDGLSFFYWDEVGLLLPFCLDGMKCFEMLPGFIKSFRSTMKAIVP